MDEARVSLGHLGPSVHRDRRLSAFVSDRVEIGLSCFPDSHCPGAGDSWCLSHGVCGNRDGGNGIGKQGFCPC